MKFVSKYIFGKELEHCIKTGVMSNYLGAAFIMIIGKLLTIKNIASYGEEVVFAAKDFMLDHMLNKFNKGKLSKKGIEAHFSYYYLIANNRLKDFMRTRVLSHSTKDTYGGNIMTKQHKKAIHVEISQNIEYEIYQNNR